MPKARPSPRFGLHAQRQETNRNSASATKDAATVACRLRGTLGRSTSARLNAPASLQGGDHALHVLEGDAHGRAVRAHLDAGRSLGTPEAQVALRRDLDRLAVGARLLLLDHHDVAPWATLGAVRAADAGRRVDLDLERPDRARDRAGRAVHHAHGV